MASPCTDVLILAAGSSKRLGFPKAFIEVDSEIGTQTLIHLYSQRFKSCNGEVTIVTRPEHHDRMCEEVPEAHIVVNPSPQMGRTGSIQVGMRSIIERRGMYVPLLIAPIDRPGVSCKTILHLLSGSSTRVPTYQRKGGHPIRVSVDDVIEVLSAVPDRPLRDLIKEERFEVNDPFLHLNVDSVADLEGLDRWLKSLRNTLCGEN